MYEKTSGFYMRVVWNRGIESNTFDHGAACENEARKPGYFLTGETRAE